MKTPNIASAVQLYYEKTEIGTAEIRELFSCGSNTAVRLKKQAQQRMAEQGVKTWDPKAVDLQCAYSAWGLDIDKLTAKLTRLRTLQKKGVLK